MPPFRSTSQRRFLYAKHPEIAARFESETPKDAQLPEHVSQQQKRKKHSAPKMIGPAARRRW